MQQCNCRVVERDLSGGEFPVSLQKPMLLCPLLSGIQNANIIISWTQVDMDTKDHSVTNLRSTNYFLFYFSQSRLRREYPSLEQEPFNSRKH